MCAALARTLKRLRNSRGCAAVSKTRIRSPSIRQSANLRRDIPRPRFNRVCNAEVARELSGLGRVSTAIIFSHPASVQSQKFSQRKSLFWVLKSSVPEGPNVHRTRIPNNFEAPEERHESGQNRVGLSLKG